MKYIGRISYSLYLVHYPIGIIFFHNKIVISFLFSIALFYCIENNKYILAISGYKIIFSYISLFVIIYWLYQIIDIKEVKDKSIANKQIFIKDMCSFSFVDGAENRLFNVLFLGDSHVLHYIRAVYDVDKRIMIYHYFLSSNRLLNNLIRISPSVITMRFSCIIISFSQLYFISLNNLFTQNINRLIDRVSNISSSILLITDNPRLNFDPNIALNKNILYGIEGDNCSIFRYDNILFRSKTYIFSINSIVTKNNKCKLKIDNTPIYVDSNHLNPVFVEKYIRNKLQKYIEIRIANKKLWISNKSLKRIFYFTFIQSGNICLPTCKNNNYHISKINMNFT